MYLQEKRAMQAGGHSSRVTSTTHGLGWKTPHRVQRPLGIFIEEARPVPPAMTQKGWLGLQQQHVGVPSDDNTCVGVSGLVRSHTATQPLSKPPLAGVSGIVVNGRDSFTKYAAQNSLTYKAP